MSTVNSQIIVVLGATGLQGGAVTRHLLSDGWRVRAVTRNPKSEKARAMYALSAEVVQAAMDDPGTLAPVVECAYRLINVKNPIRC